MLDKEAMKKGTELAEGMMLYGVLIDDLTKEELKAVAALGWNAHQILLCERLSAGR